MLFINGAEFAGSDVTLTPRPLRKLLVVDRMTDEELDAALAFFDANPRVRERWSAATEINPANPTTIAMLEALYGVERTAELLVPE